MFNCVVYTYILYTYTQQSGKSNKVYREWRSTQFLRLLCQVEYGGQTAKKRKSVNEPVLYTLLPFCTFACLLESDQNLPSVYTMRTSAYKTSSRKFTLFDPSLNRNLCCLSKFSFVFLQNKH